MGMGMGMWAWAWVVRGRTGADGGAHKHLAAQQLVCTADPGPVNTHTIQCKVGTHQTTDATMRRLWSGVGGVAAPTIV
jgi:hypothetical protein